MTNPVSHAFGTMFYRIKLRVGSGKRLLVYQQTTCALSDHRHVVMQQQMILHMKNINELLIEKPLFLTSIHQLKSGRNIDHSYVHRYRRSRLLKVFGEL